MRAALVRGRPRPATTQRHHEIDLTTVAQYRHAHGLPGLSRPQRVRVVVNVVDLHTIEFDDGIPTANATLLRRTPLAHGGQQYAALGLHVVGNGSEIGAIAT